MGRQDNFFLAPFQKDSSLIIQPAANGGYTVLERDEKYGEMMKVLGAFTCVDDLIAALANSLGGFGSYQGQGGEGSFRGLDRRVSLLIA